MKHTHTNVIYGLLVLYFMNVYLVSYHGQLVQFQCYWKNINNKPLEFPKPIGDDTKDLLRKMLTVKEEARLEWK